MRIGLVILHADPSRGGAERYTVDLAAALARRGHDVRVLAGSFSDEIEPALRVPLDARGATRKRRYLRFLDSLDAHIDSAKYDIVHAMLPVRRCDVYHPHAGMAAAAMEKPNRFFNPRRIAMAKVERELLSSERGPIVIALSEYVKRSIRRSYPSLDADRLATLFNAVDLERFQPALRPFSSGAEVEALFIGQDFARKGLMPAIAAMHRVNDARLRLTVVGKPNRHSHLPFQDVNVVGRVKDARPYYAAADFFVLPTKHDPCSLVVLEALAVGVPVISTKFNGACEIMTDGVHGFVLDDPNDIEALCEAMKKMLDPELRARMSRACLELRPQLSYERHLDRLEEIYRLPALRSRSSSQLADSGSSGGAGGGLE